MLDNRSEISASFRGKLQSLPCPWALAKEWSARTETRILRGYGMTELFRPLSYFADDPTDISDAVGRPVPGVEIRVVDNGEVTSQGDAGELLIRSPAAMSGYLSDPEETQAVLVDGWFKTGDLATISPEDFVRIVGRKRERILGGGYSIFPQEIEAALLSHPAVAEAAVVGVPNPDLGEEVAAFVTLKPMAQITAEELLAHCMERLAPFKYPRQVNIIKELTKGATGKILKSELVRGSFSCKRSLHFVPLSCAGLARIAFTRASIFVASPP